MTEIICEPGALARTAAEQMIALGQEALDERGRFFLALSGGSTPQPLYRLLASDEFAPALDWARVHVFWSDERVVPPDHPDSNYAMARQALLDSISIPKYNIHRIQAELDPRAAAWAYEDVMRQVFKLEPDEQQPPAFDLILLGMGDDGHTASLFPDSAALNESQRWVVANWIPQLETWRITFTLPLLNAARAVLFLVRGEAKASRLYEVLRGPEAPDRLPAQAVKPTSGDPLWLMDQAAASQL
jgi:6-phosphogluconolactonase